jgi:hypothetical protein
MSRDAATGPRTPLTRRRRAMLVVLVAAALTAVVGLTSPLWIKSPQQLAAETQPPPSTVLTAPVERRILRDTLVLRGDVTSRHTFEATPGSRADAQAIVTAVKVKGESRSPRARWCWKSTDAHWSCFRERDLRIATSRSRPSHPVRPWCQTLAQRPVMPSSGVGGPRSRAR